MVLFRNDSDKFTNYWCRQTSTYDNLSEYVRDVLICTLTGLAVKNCAALKVIVISGHK